MERSLAGEGRWFIVDYATKDDGEIEADGGGHAGEDAKAYDIRTYVMYVLWYGIVPYR